MAPSRGDLVLLVERLICAGFLVTPASLLTWVVYATISGHDAGALAMLRAQADAVAN